MEFKAWMFAQLFPFGMTDAFGLAGFASRKQFEALVIKEKKGFDLYFETNYFLKFITKTMILFFRFNYERIRVKAMKMGVIEEYKNINLEMIEDFVKKKKPPIVMVDQTGYMSDPYYSEGLLHWVVVTGFSSDEIKINDPDMGTLIISKVDFIKAIDLKKNFRTDKRLVIIDNNRN